MNLKTKLSNLLLLFTSVLFIISCMEKPGMIAHETSLTIPESQWGIEFNAFPPHLNKYPHELSAVTESKIDTLIEKTSNLGVKWVRLSVDWTNVVDTTGNYHWSRLDRIVKGLSGKKIEIVLCINGGHKLYTGGNAPTSPEEINHWKEYTTRLVNRYKSTIKYWELWNEPNTVWFWKPHPVATQYVNLMQEFHSLLEEIHPSAKIVGGSMARLDMEYADSLFNLGIGQYINAFTFHPYNEFPEAIIRPVRVSVKTPHWYIEADHSVHALKEMVASKNPSMEVWQGECGYPSEDNSSGWVGNGPWSPIIQAKWLLRRMFTDLSYNAQRISYFCLREYYTGGNVDLGTGVLNSKGLLKINSLNEKPAWDAYRNLISLLNGDLKASVSGKYVPKIQQFGSFHNCKPKNLQFIEIHNNENNRFLAYWVVWRMQDMVNNGKVIIEAKDPFEKPVLVNLLTDEIKEIKSKSEGNHQILFDLPLADYPFVVTEMNAINFR